MDNSVAVNKKRLLDTFLDYVRIDSESTHEAAMAQRLAADLGALGCQLYVDDTRGLTGSDTGNLYATLPGNVPGEPVLLFAHMDTVTPGKGIEPVITDGVIRSAGETILASDDKAGIAAIVEALRTVVEKKLPRPTIQAVFTVCEEIGLLGSRYLEYDRLIGKKAVVFDAGGTGVIVGQAPGHYTLNATVVGRSAHAGGSPQKGISAIRVLCEAVSNMKLLRIDPETTANIGTFCAEYPTNIVPERARLTAECRSQQKDKLEAQAQHMEDCLRAACEKYGAKLELEKINTYNGYRHEQTDPFVLRVSDALRAAGLEPKVIQDGGGSDANNLNPNGICALLVSTGMRQVHTCQEEIEVKVLEQTAEVALRLLADQQG